MVLRIADPAISEAFVEVSSLPGLIGFPSAAKHRPPGRPRLLVVSGEPGCSPSHNGRVPSTVPLTIVCSILSGDGIVPDQETTAMVVLSLAMVGNGFSP